MLQRLLLAVLLSSHIALLAWSAARHSATLNEPAHLVAGLSHWKFGRFDLYRVNPPLVRMVAAIPITIVGHNEDWSDFAATPGSRPVFEMGRNFMDANKRDAQRLITLARWACIPFSVVGGYVCFLWARDLYGVGSGMLALVLWCFSPDILAHASLIAPDAGATAVAIGASYLYSKWMPRPTLSGAALAGVALGLALLAKTTLLVLYPAWFVVWFLSRRNAGSQEKVMHDRSKRKELLWLVIIGVVSIGVVNLGYGFEQTGTALGDFDFVSDTFGGVGTHQRGFGNRFRDGWLEMLPVPLPANYLLGIDVQRRDFEDYPDFSYLRGQFSNKGWWYYYLYGLTVKVPLGLWVLLIFAFGGRITRCVQALRGRRESNAKVNWRDELAVLVPLFAILALVSSQSGFSHHFRYILPIFPFAFIWISQVAEYASRASRIVVGLAALWFVGSSLSVYPHSLSYFNELAGGPRGGHAHMIHSSIDWGQDLLCLKQWVDEHPEAKPLRLIYCGDFDPQLLGIQFEAPEFTHPPDGSPSTLVLKPGWYAVSVNFLRGYDWRAPIGDGRFVTVPQDSCTALLKREPTALAGYSIYIYEIPRTTTAVAD